jgi:hypothetical protein
MSTHDLPPQDPNDFEQTLEKEYSSTATEDLSGLAGYDDPNPEKRQQVQAAYEAIAGSTPEEKLANIEAMPAADIRLKRQVGRYTADIARGWIDEEQKIYESLKLEGATKNVETEFGTVTLKNIRHGQVIEGGTPGKHWGDAEFDSLPSITLPKLEDHQEFYDQTQRDFKTKPGDPNEMVSTTIMMGSREAVLQVARVPQAKWGNKDYHFYANWGGGSHAIFEAKLPILIPIRQAPVERPLTEGKFSFHLEQIQVNLDQDAGQPMGRMKFNVRVVRPTQETPDSSA